jgi:glutamine amidotransferase
MQFLFEVSEEMGEHAGLGLLPGRVVRFPEDGLKVPHMGWNQLHRVGTRHDAMQASSSLLADVPEGGYAYFVHSFYVRPADEADVLARTDYGLSFASVVGRGNVFGVQFHPEKSQSVGLQILSNFVKMVS